MRTTLVIVMAAVSAFLIPSALAATDPGVPDITQLLPKDLLPKLGQGPSDSELPTPPPIVKDAGPKGFLSNLVDTVVEVSEDAARGFLGLGLALADGAFDGMEEGGQPVVAAGNAVAAKPVESAVVATVTLAVAGAASGLVYLLQRYGSLGAIALPLYSRIAKSHLLDNRVRAQIFQLIQENPGVNVSEIARRLDIAWGTATHHLQKLRQDLMVSVRVASNQKCYFQNGGSYTPHEMDVLSATKSDTARRIAEHLAQNGPQCHKDVAQALDLTPALLSFHASRLAERGILGRRREGRRTILTVLETNLNPSPRPAQAH